MGQPMKMAFGSLLGGVLLLAVCSSPASAQSASAKEPKTLRECYLRVAMEKTTADMVYLARDICDRVFGKRPRVVVFLDASAGKCVERWFDNNGRYENGGKICAFEPNGEQHWTFACEHKNKSTDTRVELRETDHLYERVGEVTGDDPGLMFKTLAACIKAKHLRTADQDGKGG